jgi:hypothetical protein
MMKSPPHLSRLLKKGVITYLVLCVLFGLVVVAAVLLATHHSDEFRQKTVLKSLEKQQQLFRNLHRGFQQTTDFVIEKTDVKTLLEQIRLLQKLAQLSDAEKRWLIETTPALRKLANDLSLTAVMHDESVMTLVTEASEGSLKALYQLGKEPLLKKLFEDQEFVETIKQIRLTDLLQNVKHVKSPSVPL